MSNQLETTKTIIFQKRSDLHLLRKLWHVSTGVVGLVIYYSSNQTELFWAKLVMFIAIASFLMEFIRLNNKKLNQLFCKYFSLIMRNSEKDKMSGLPFYALGVSVSLFLYQKDIALISILFLVFSDPLSSFFGVLFGKEKILPNKSLQGSFAGFLCCLLITLIYLSKLGIDLDARAILFSIAAAFIGSISELISAMDIDDNLTIPIISGLGMSLLNYYLAVI